MLAVSCRHAPSVVGKWKGTMFGQDVTAEFKDDKSMTADIKAGAYGAVFSGTYVVDAKTLTLNFQSYKLEGVDDALAPLAKSFLDPVLAKPYQGKYHFNNEDELAITYQNKTDVIKRIQEDAG